MMIVHSMLVVYRIRRSFAVVGRIINNKNARCWCQDVKMLSYHYFCVTTYVLSVP